MKITQNIDGVEVVGEVSDDTAAYMVERGYATYTTDPAEQVAAKKANEKPAKGSSSASRRSSGTSVPSNSSTPPASASDADSTNTSSRTSSTL